MTFGFLKIVLRNIKKHKGYSFINIFGLAVGMTCTLLIMLWVMDELSYDRFHSNVENIYRIEQEQDYSGRKFHVNVTPFPMAEGIKTDIPEVELATPTAYTGPLLLKYQEKTFFEENVRAVDADFFKMFSFNLKQGDASTVFDNPHAMVINQELATKYFGDTNPVGQVISVNNEFEFTVSGVFDQLPTNTVVKFDLLVPFKFLEDLGQRIDRWGWNSVVTYVQLNPNTNIDEFNQKITTLRHSKVVESITDQTVCDDYAKHPPTPFMINPLVNIHLHSHFGYGNSMGDIIYVYILSVIAAFILLIACINFMNLSTARSANRAKEVGMRKVIGAGKINLIGQFFSESILMAFISLFFAIILVALLLPGFSQIADKQFTLMTLLRWDFLLGMLATTVITGMISGTYPALFLSSFKPVSILRRSLSGGKRGAIFRKVLVVTQFSLSIILIVGTIIVYNQLTFMKEKELGYDREQLIFLPLRGSTQSKYEILKAELLNTKSVVNVSGTGQVPTNIGSNSGGVDWDGKEPEEHVLVSFNAVGFDYAETMKIDLVEGRSFSRNFTTDTSSAFMINEVLAKIISDEPVVNKRLSFLGIDGTIIGVMKDYHFQSVRNAIEPLALYVAPQNVRYAVIRLTSGNPQKALQEVEASWYKIIPDYPFEYRFVDDELNKQYAGWDKLSSLLKYFATIAIIIACLGLFGLASFTAEQRTKEIGVRKTLGASVPSLVILLSKEFTKWVIFSNIIGLPLSYFLMNSWLQDFAFRVPLGAGTFILSALLAIVIALITVSYQAIKAALANPVQSLRYE